ncbi:hypothetical protein OC846_004143 [Tilletia horrida]|uniref:EKC/KEOPS complex subunit CGI121 n=1 Tax=Tilletia horrida TaxID=155126 RepID=A0AAN6GNS9_9BASI|nr:hypothetical protein OC845_004234 [Tilletia horrida]KAK0549317.1 hypothetical protein OC846_004143 [Tilletia horrida]
MRAISWTFPHLPAAQRSVTVALFPSLEPAQTTASDLRNKLISIATASPDTYPNLDEERENYNFAFLDARLITSERHLRTGVHQALLAVARGQANEGVEGGMKTKTANSEILFALHPSGNIGESIRKFGISATTTAMLVLRVGPVAPSAESILSKMQAILPNQKVADLCVDGVSTLDAQLGALTSWKEVESVYKLGKDLETLFGGSVKGRKSVSTEDTEKCAEEQLARQRWLEQIVTSMCAMKPVAA